MRGPTAPNARSDRAGGAVRQQGRD